MKEDKFFIKSIKASILNIDVSNKTAKIKVEFISHQEDSNDKKTESKKNIKDIWTFEKDMSENNPIWTLVEVSDK